MNSLTSRYEYHKSNKRKYPTSKIIKQNVALIQKLYLAQDKLLPVIYSLGANSHHKGIITNSYYLTRHQIEDAVWASKVTNEFCRKISHIDDTVNVRTSDWDIGNVPTDADGKVFIDTSTLFHLLDLNKTLSYLLETYGGDKEFQYTNIDYDENHIDRKTKSEVEENVRKYLVKLSEPLLLENFFNNYQRLFEGRKSNEVIVMSSQNFETGSNKQRSRASVSSVQQNFETGSNKQRSRASVSSVQSVESLSSEASPDTSRTGSTYENVVSQVTDVYGARDIIYHCINDLTRVKSYLETERIDVGIDTDDGDGRRRSSLKSASSFKSPTKTNTGRKGCCCENCMADGGGSGIDGEETVICIKGKNDDENDIQIIVKQPQTCCKCKCTKKQDLNSAYSQTGKAESGILHSKDSEGSLVCSTSSYEEEGNEDFTESNNNISNCSQVPFNRPNNLCLTTDTGEELMLSFTLKPIDREPEELRSKRNTIGERSKSDIKKKSGSGIRQSSKGSLRGSRSKIRQGSRSSSRRTPSSKTGSLTRSNESFHSAKNQSRLSNLFSNSKNVYSSEVHPQNYADVYFAEAIIPLTRTKVCSSLEFDVAMVKTNLRKTGIVNDGRKMVVRLNEIGVNNLLRASRPAKCARRAVLSEKPKKWIPYSASLRSLPLDEKDLNVINESLQMNLQKVKNSTDIRRNVQNMLYYFGVTKSKEQVERLPWTISH